MLQNRDVGQLLVILTVAEQGSINKAAEVLFISQPALTRAVREFETQIGGRVFERGAKGVKLTDLGDAIVDHARAIRAEFQGAIRDIEHIRLGTRRHLFVGAAQYHPVTLLADALAKTMASNPEVMLHLRYGAPDELVAWLDHGAVEVVLGPLLAGEEARGYRQEVIFYDELAIYCGPGHPLGCAPTVSVDALHDAEWVLGPPGSFVRERVEGLFHNEGRHLPKVRLEIDDVATRRALVSQTDYVSAFQRNQVQREVEAGLVVAVDYQWPQDERAIGATLLAPASDLVRELIDTLRRQYHAGGMRVSAQARAPGPVG
ncbi:MAG TPA: LysR family transcriptional regulator [Conexibacter sp.]